MSDQLTADELRRLFPAASNDVIRRSARSDVQPRANDPDRDSRKAGKLERNSWNGALGQGQIQNLNSGKVLVRLTSYRARLLDEDNLCEKYHIDCCRYAGLIRQDSPGAAKIEVRQEKVAKGEPEFVRIEIFETVKGPFLT